MNLAAVLMSLEMAPVGKLQLGISEVRGPGAAWLLRLASVGVSGGFSATADSELLPSREVLLTRKGVEMSFALA